MKKTSLTIMAAALLGSAAMSGCSPAGEPEVTPAQQAELDQSRDELKRRGWVDIPPMPGTEKPTPAEGAGEGEGEATTGDPSSTEPPPTE